MIRAVPENGATSRRHSSSEVDWQILGVQDEWRARYQIGNPDPKPKECTQKADVNFTK